MKCYEILQWLKHSTRMDSLTENTCVRLCVALLVVLYVLSGCNSISDTSQHGVAQAAKQNTSTQVSNSNKATITGKFTPPDGKLLMFIGQDSDTIADYIAGVPEDNLEGVTLYTQLKSANPDETLLAVFEPADWHAGTVDFTATLSAAPDAALAIGLALDQCDGSNHANQVAQGNYDVSLKRLIDYLESLAPRKVFLRIGYEFDGAWNCYKPESYKAAYRYIAKAINKRELSNVATVWQSATWPDASIAGEHTALYDHKAPGFLDSWYPGDDVVDWVGVSVFYRDLQQWSYTPPDTPDRAQQALLDFARKHNKPVMISESAPQGYRIGGLTHSVIQENNPKSVTAEQIWEGWFIPYFDFIYSNSDVIRSVAYINTHWEEQGMWKCAPGISAGQPGCNGGNWGDTRIQANPLIKQRWLEQVTSDQWVQSANY